jgi:hypothetical protein
MIRIVITGSEPYGRFGRREYLLHRGHLSNGPLAELPIELIAPADVGAGVPAVAVEVAHPQSGQVLGRDVYLGPRHLFGGGFRHAAIVGGAPDAATLAAFARALREQARDVLGPVAAVHGVGFSATGNLLADLLASRAGAGAFDGSLVGTSASPALPTPRAGRVVRLSSESDFLDALAAGGAELAAGIGQTTNLRWYVATGGPHVADTPPLAGANVAGCGSPLGTTPLDWTPIARAAFDAADAWARGRALPPDNRLPEIDPGSGEIVRDGRGHARGGVRLPPLELAEATFHAHASSCGRGGHCGLLFGCYQGVRSLGDRGFFAGAGDYLPAFGAVLDGLVTARLLPRPEASRLRRTAGSAAARGLTFTQHYARLHPRLEPRPPAGAAEASVDEER